MRILRAHELLHIIDTLLIPKVHYVGGVWEPSTFHHSIVALVVNLEIVSETIE